MKFCHFLGAMSLGAFLLLGCEGDNITKVSQKETDISLAERVGPVSQYGQLLAGKIDGVGHIYGSCKGISAGNEVQVRGMSMYWSLLSSATMYYSDAGVSAMVRDMKVELIRLAIGTTENWGGTSGFIKDPDAQRELIKNAVMAAVKNDIYVIIDWHSHTATEQLEEATQFFDEMAQTYGGYNNVIFEIFNEPTKQSWDEIRDYANQIVATIRKYSDNLILVGSPNWDQMPYLAIGKEVEDPKNNIAYTFHYYAMTHSTWEKNNAERAIKAGLPLFVSEWGTGTADGKGTPGETQNKMWQDWMDSNMLSSANWSASKINEGSAAFLPESTVDTLLFSPSGEAVKAILDKNPDKYTACKADKKKK
jgi:hypothetical protein